MQNLSIPVCAIRRLLVAKLVACATTQLWPVAFGLWPVFMAKLVARTTTPATRNESQPPFFRRSSSPPRGESHRVSPAKLVAST